MKALSTLALVFVAACAWKPQPIVMVGPTTEVSALAGEWSGEYYSGDTQRSGTIWFKLVAGRDSAFGDVLMVPRENATPMPEPSAPTWRNPQRVLTIKFVRVAAPQVSGSIDPYPSPDCGCTLFTFFRGELKGDRIEGEFTTLHDGEGKMQGGKWWVVRQKQPPR